MANPANLDQTRGNRIGATMLFHNHSGTDDFAADAAVYQQMYDFGYRAVQVRSDVQSDNWLTGLRQWAASLTEETWVYSIGFLVNAGDKPECPVGVHGNVCRAKEAFQKHVAKAQACGARSLFGPYSAGLLAGHYPWTPEHDEKCVNWFKWLNDIAEAAKLVVEAEPINRFETGVNTVAHMARLLTEAQVGEFVKIGPDTCHQGFGEGSTVQTWRTFRQLFGRSGHLSDFGRSVIGAEQAITGLGIIPYLATGKSGIECWNVEAVGSDVDPGISTALGIRIPLRHKGIEVMKLSFDRIVTEFAKC
jgi:hypothetical protein